MSKVNIGHHISQQYNAELEDIRNRVLKMGGLIEQQLTKVITAINEQNIALAEEVIRDDYKVNSMEVALDEECNHVLARRQPAASDLRLIVAVIKTITDLERIGDQAKRVAKAIVRVADPPKKSFVAISHLADHVQKMLHDTLDAFARTDVEAALALAREDLNVDEEYQAIIRQAITYMMEDPRAITRMLDVVWMARALERIGDHAKNICEYIIYFVKGKDVRHTSLEQMAKQVHQEGREKS